MIEFRLLGYRRDKSLGLFWPASDQERGRGDEEIGLAEGETYCGHGLSCVRSHPHATRG